MAARKKSVQRKIPPPLEQILDSAAKIEEYFSVLQRHTTIMFVDLANSTLYKQQRGFFVGLAKTRYHNTKVAEVAKQFGGTVVKFIGDGVLCRWDSMRTDESAYRAINAAIRIQETFHKHNLTLKDMEKVESRIGLAFGAVADFYGNDPQGTTVDLAARIQALAKPGQILVHRDVAEKTNTARIISHYGKGQGFTASDYVGSPAQVKLKGFPDIQEVMEIRWGDNVRGIAEMEIEADIWENYHYNAVLFQLDSNSPLASTHFGISFDLKYEMTLRMTRFPFVCVDSAEEFDRTIRDSSLFVRYRLPRRKLINSSTEDHFVVNCIHVNDIALAEQSVGHDKGSGYYFSRVFTGAGLDKLLGQRVTVHYQLNTVVSKGAGYYFMTNENPVRGLTMTFDVGKVPIRRVNVVDYFGASKAPRFMYTPDPNNPQTIQVHVSEMIPARGGVVFIWRLEESHAHRNHSAAV